MEKKDSFLCVAALLLGIALFSTVEIAGKAINNIAKIESFVMVFMRFFVTGVVLVAISLPGYLKKNMLTRIDWCVFLLNGLIGIAASITLFHIGIDMFENASSAAVVFSANALFTVVIARFINHEKLTLMKCIAVLLGLIGISLFIFEKGNPDLQVLGSICVMCCSAFLFGISVCITRRVVKRYGAMLFMGMSSLIGSIITLPIALLTMNEGVMERMHATFWPMCYMVLIGTTLAYFLYYYGLSGVSASKASIAFFLKPVLACIFASIYFYPNNKMNAWTITGTVIIVLAMSLTLIKEKTLENSDLQKK